ncbi:Hypothetical protein D9617_33g038690 [Elsinoe fawcettii]|nr:Hypothetical protein D9617_33g038690 [Elsinoe fawcettii]
MVSRIPNDIFQFSTVSALMAGLCTSGPQISHLPGYGTHGLGTCSELNGEVLYLDGVVWHMTTSPAESDDRKDQEALNSHAKKTQPVIKRAAAGEQLPFVQVTTFKPEFQIRLPGKQSIGKASLLDVLSGDPSGQSGGENSFLPFLVTGTFESLTLRIGGPKQSKEEALSSVTGRAPQWRLKGVKGTMFGFYSPEWSNGISVAGFHGHFIEDEGTQEVRRGGHVLDFEMDGEANGRIEWAVSGHHHLGFPRGREWEGLDLKVDAAGIHKAEG